MTLLPRGAKVQRSRQAADTSGGDAAVVYGDWPYADYPAYPYSWGYPGYIAAGVIATGLAFGGAYALGRWASGGIGVAAADTGAAAVSTGPAEA
jgi:hypothetical protein